MTPGPWMWSPNGKTICRFDPPYNGFSPRWTLDKTEQQDNINAISKLPELVETLKNTLRALEIHLDIGSNRKNISRAELCPCETNEVAQARAILAAIEGRATS